MKNALKMLNVVWPNGIPHKDYERALEVASQAEMLANREPKAPTKKAPRTWESLIGEPGLKKIREALSTGPATAKEVREVVGLASPSVWAGLRLVADVCGHRKGKNGARSIPVYTLKKGA